MTDISPDPLDDYDPLKAHQFETGKSGNRKGRPNGALGQKIIVHAIAREKHTITVGGKKQKRSTVELVLQVLHRKALGGDLAAKRLLDDLRDQFSPTEANNKGHGCLVVPEPMGETPEEWAALLGIEIVDVDEDAVREDEGCR